MLKKIAISSAIILVIGAVSGFFLQDSPIDERAAERQMQESLPQSKDDIWKIFGKCKVHFNEEKGTYSIDYTPEVKAMEGKQITASGFMLPLEANEEFSHFLLSKRTPTCAFCPPGEPNEVIEVFTKKPITWDEGIVVISGTMAFTSNPELGLFLQLKDSHTVNIKPDGVKEKIKVW